MGTYLDKILDWHRQRARDDSRSLDQLIERTTDLAAPRGFEAALARADRLAVIAEIKRRSPSKGELFANLDPAELAITYETAGATCMSVLTDEPHFGGSVTDLRAARAATELPVLRKDFVVSELDVVDTRLMGADCVLLIAAALEPSQLADLHTLAEYVGLDALVEIHDERELEHALAANATLVGVNQRDLETFQVDHERAVRMAAVIGGAAVKVAESGVRGRADAESLRAAGYDAVLVGETLVTAEDPIAALTDLTVG